MSKLTQARWYAKRRKDPAYVAHRRKTAREYFYQHRERQRDLALQHRHHISMADYWERVKVQQGRCAACGLPLDFSGKRLPPIDHNHACCPGPTSCGKCIRGIVHEACNTILGMANDSPVILQSLIAYLSRD